MTRWHHRRRDIVDIVDIGGGVAIIAVMVSVVLPPWCHHGATVLHCRIAMWW
jgi:hypothetical protein